MPDGGERGREPRVSVDLSSIMYPSQAIRQYRLLPARQRGCTIGIAHVVVYIREVR